MLFILKKSVGADSTLHLFGEHSKSSPPFDWAQGERDLECSTDFIGSCLNLCLSDVDTLKCNCVNNYSLC
jgi:hypothetical protein